MNNAERLVAMLNALYPIQSAGCLEARAESRLLAYEGDDLRSYLKKVREPEDAPFVGFLIKNDKQHQIFLLALDACFFHSDGPKRCDCLIFDDNYLCFVELKLNVTVRRQSTAKLNDARQQLGESIRFFKTNVLPNVVTDIPHKLEAYAVMQDAVYPRNRAARQTVFVRFLEQYGVRLFEASIKEF
ncbi:MAG: hypothetical protein R3A44_01345 [Caldilineaceae bacterium]